MSGVSFGDSESRSISDPWHLVHAIDMLFAQGKELGFEFQYSTDFQKLAEMRRLLRDSELSPMFDVKVDRHLPETAFWMSATDSTGEVMGLQAFRLDEAWPNLSEWVLGWMMGLYARRREMIVPRQVQPPAHSMTALISGKVVYLGEFYIGKQGKRGLTDIFSRLGMFLALIKWQPQTIWALTGTSMATRGHLIRAGFDHIEPSFLTWQWSPEGAEAEEWVALATRRQLEFLISEMTTTKAKYQPSSSR